MIQLSDRLSGARETLSEVKQKVARDPAVEDSITKWYGNVDDTILRIDEWLSLIEARSLAMINLQKLPGLAASQAIPFRNADPSPFRIRRLLACQAYLSVSWALADEITKWALPKLTSSSRDLVHIFQIG